MAYNIEMGWKGSALVRGLKNAGTLWHHVARMQKEAVVEAVKYNRSGELLKITLGKLDAAGHRVSSTFSKFNHIVGTKTRSTVALTSRTIEMQGRSFNKVTKSIGAMSAAIRRSTVAEGIHKNNLALNKQIASLQTWLSTNNKAGLAANRMWKELAVGNIMEYTGRLLTLQNRLRAIINLRSKLAAKARSAGSTGGAPGAGPTDAVIGTELRDTATRRAQASVDKLATAFRKLGASTTQLVTAEGIFKRLSAISEKHVVSVKTIERMWKQVSSGEIKNYKGHMRDIQIQMLKMHGLQQKITAAQKGTVRASNRIKESLIQRMALLDSAIRKNTRLNKTVARGQHLAKDMLLSWRGIARLIVSATIHRAFFKIIESIREATTLAIDFSIAISEVRTIDTARMSTEKMSDALVKLSDSYGLTVLEQAEAMYQTLSNQVADGAEAVMFLDSANRLAKATVSQTSDAVNVLTSAINAWGLRTSEAEKLNARFFKTVELGRLRLDEMGQVFGRVALPAAQLGVSVEELLSMLAQTTIKGVKLSEAMTFVRNIFQKLIRPTEEMKDAYKEWGVVSGEQLIKAHGIAGALAMIEERTKGSSSELGKMFGRIRAIAGSMVFAGEGVQQFERTLAQLHASGPSYLQAIEDVMTATGKRIRLELNEVKNAFLTEFSDPLTLAIAHVNENMIDFSDAVKSVIPTLKQLPKAIGATAIAAAGLSVALMGVSVASVAAVAVMGGIFVLGGLAAAAVASQIIAWSHAWGQQAEAAKRLVGLNKVLMEQAKTMRAERRAMQKEKLLSGMDEGVETIMVKIEQLAVHTRRRIAQEMALVFKNLEADERNLDTIIDKTRKAYSKTVSAAKKDFSTIDGIFKSMVKSTKAMYDAGRDLRFDIALRGADNLDDKLELISEKMSDLQLARKGGLASGASFKAIEQASVKISAMIMDQQKLIRAGVTANKELIKDLMQAGHDLERQRRDMLFDISFDKQSNLAGKLQTIRLEVGRLNKEASFLEKIISDPKESTASKTKAFERYSEIADQIIDLEMTARKEAKSTSEENKKIAEEHRDLNRKDADELNKHTLKRQALEEQLAAAKKTRNRKDRDAAIDKAEKDFEAHQLEERNFEAQLGRDRQDIDPKQDVPSIPEMGGRYNSIIDSVQKMRKVLGVALEVEMEKRLVQETAALGRLDTEIEKRKKILSLTREQVGYLEKVSLRKDIRKAEISALMSSIKEFRMRNITDADTEEKLKAVMAGRGADIAELGALRKEFGVGTDVGQGLTSRWKSEKAAAKLQEEQIRADKSTGVQRQGVRSLQSSTLEGQRLAEALHTKLIAPILALNDIMTRLPARLSDQILGVEQHGPDIDRMRPVGTGMAGWRKAMRKLLEGKPAGMVSLLREMDSSSGRPQPQVSDKGQERMRFFKEGGGPGDRSEWHTVTDGEVTQGNKESYKAALGMVNDLRNLTKHKIYEQELNRLIELEETNKTAIGSMSDWFKEGGVAERSKTLFQQIGLNIGRTNKHLQEQLILHKDINEAWGNLPQEKKHTLSIEINWLGQKLPPEVTEQVAKEIAKLTANEVGPALKH